MADDERRIAFVYFDAGGGHRAAMNALVEVFQRQRRPWTTFPVNLQHVLDDFDFIKKFTGIRVEDVYNRMLAGGKTLGAAQLLKVLHAAIRFREATLTQTITAFWRSNPVDMVVSVIPNFNRILARSLQDALPDAPFATIITDIADYPPHFWMEKESEYLICGSERAEHQAKVLGHGEDRVFRTSGMVIHPKFYETGAIDRRHERELRGLDPECPTALVLFGGSGSNAMFEIAERLEHCRHELQVIFICGRNAELAARLRRRTSRYRFFVEEFTTAVPLYMRISDFLIGKPGPGCISEALTCGLPVIVESNIKTLPQERYNAEWVREARFGIVVGNFGDINGAVSTLLHDPTYRQNVAQVRNRAVFEIPDILQTILETRAQLRVDQRQASVV